MKVPKRQICDREDFAWSQWSVKDVRLVIADSLADLVANISDVISVPDDQRTFDNTVRALEYAGVGVGDTLNKVHILESVSPRAKLREVCSQEVAKADVLLKEIYRNRELYEAILVCQKSLKRDSIALAEQDQRLLKDFIDYFQRCGFDLSPENEKYLLLLWGKLSIAESQFSRNIANDDRSILVSRGQLAGLSEAYISRLTKVGDRYRVGLSYPEIVPFLSQAESASKRRQLATLNYTKGTRKNLLLMTKILKIRQDIAELLGFAHHGDLIASQRMVKSAAVAEKFISDIAERVSPSAKEDVERLTRLKQSHTGKNNEALEFYDVAYYRNLEKRDLYALDQEEVRAYFPLDHVVSEVFILYEKLFAIRFVREDISLWHEDAQIYRINNADGALLSYLILDLHPRKGKYAHAAVMDIQTGRRNPDDLDTYICPVEALVCNFPRSTKTTPALLSHDEVVTFMHECGHALHNALAGSDNPSQSGFHVKWDFVETPSQMLENFAWDEKVLVKISQHYETGKPLPREMIMNLKGSKNHMVAYDTARQATLALYDLVLHTVPVSDINQTFSKLSKQYTNITPPESHSFAAGFGHLIGYSAGYYSYMWALVYAADAYTAFAAKGVVSTSVGRKFRKEVLSKGSERDEKASMKAFLGRNVSKRAFYKQIGLS